MIDRNVARLLARFARPRTAETTVDKRAVASDGSAALSVLVIADAAGATLQINLLRPLAAAVASGAVALHVLTEEDERRALKTGGSPVDLLETAWRRAEPDLVFVSRYGGSLAQALLDKAAQARRPLIYHLDDNLFEVPLEAGREKALKYGAPERQRAIAALLGQAALAYVSTERLAAQLRERVSLAPNVFIGDIASASDPLPARSARAGGGLHLGYMASSSHAADLAMALPGIVAALAQCPELRFTLFGSLKPPPELAAFGRRIEHVPAVADYDAFLLKLNEMAWDWGLAPLCPGRFNEAKTDTKWVEYAAAGIPCLVSDHPVYRACQAEGAAIAVADGAWAETLPRVIVDRELAGRTGAAARDRLVSRHGLARMATQLERAFVAAGLSERQAVAVAASA